MRLLLIEEDARRCAHIRQRLVSWRPQAQLVVHNPVSQGALAPEFLAQGFDAVLLADSWPGSRAPPGDPRRAPPPPAPPAIEVRSARCRVRRPTTSLCALGMDVGCVMLSNTATPYVDDK